MPRYTYTGDPDRYYPTLGLTPEPDSSYDLQADPGDGRWTALDQGLADQPATPAFVIPPAIAVTAPYPVASIDEAPSTTPTTEDGE